MYSFSGAGVVYLSWKASFADMVFEAELGDKVWQHRSVSLNKLIVGLMALQDAYR